MAGLGRSPRTRAHAILVAAVLAVSLTACANSGGPSATTDVSSGSAARGGSTPAGSSATTDELYAAAKREGKLSWYTSWATDDANGVASAFEHAYPGIDVTTLRAKDIDLLARITTEQRAHKFTTDIVVTDAPTMSELLHSDELMPFTASSQRKLPAGLSLPAGYDGVAILNTSVIAYNPEALKQAGLAPPTSWSDFAKPEWKGKFSAIANAVPFYRSLIAVMGHEAAHKLLERIGNNSPRLVASHTLALTQVQSGEPVAAAVGYGYKASQLHAKTPDRIVFVNPNPLPTMAGLVDLVRHAPHPNAAKLFETWLLSKAGQKTVVSVTHKSSLLPGVGNDPTVYNPGKWKPAWVAPIISSDDYNQLKTEMKQAFHTP